MTTVGVLTGGGDCPGLNAVIRAVVRTGAKHGFDTIGIRDGWLGLVAGNVEPLTDYSVTGILPKGGTILGTSRTNPFKNEADVQRLRDNIRKFGIDAIVAIGGEDTLGVANKLSQMGIPVVGVPKTIDNDVAATDYTFGFDTAVSIVTEAIDRLHTTAESHHRIMVVEVMGLRARYERGKKFSIVVVAEGAQPKGMKEAIAQSARTDEFGHVTLGGVGNYLRDELESRLGMEVRVTVLGHVQRGGSPTAHDRVLATRFGVAAADLIQKKEFGKMVALRGDDIVAVPLEEAVAHLKTVDMDLYKIASIFYGG